MKIKSLRLRIALMTSFLIALTCLSMMVLLGNSGLRSMDRIGESLQVGEAPALSFDPARLGRGQEVTIVLDEARERFTLNNLYITLAVTLASGLMAYFVSGRALKPLEDFSKQVEKIRINNLEAMHLDTDSLVEFRDLTHAFNDMLDRLHASYAAQKQFTGNAAHELRTPLSLLQVRLEVFEADHPTMDSESRAFIAFLKEQVDRLSATLKTLLEMSNLQNRAMNERVALLPLLDEVITDLTPLAEKKGIRLEKTGPAMDLVGSDTLLARLFYNLTENAIKYGRPGGFVHLGTEKKEGRAIILVEDSGYGIPLENRKDIFQAFYRLPSSESQREKGVGLGLALAREICRLHGGRIEVVSSSDAGTTMAVILPLSQSLRPGADFTS